MPENRIHGRQFAASRAISRLFAAALLMWSTTVGAATILVLGDSLSAGYGIAAGEAWPSLLAQRLDHPPFAVNGGHRVINASISGETSAGGRHRLPALLDQHRPTIVVLALGANDGLRGLPLDALHDNLTAMIDASRRKAARVLLVGMRLPPNYGPYAEEFERVFTELARRAKVPLVPFLLEGLRQSPEHFQADHLHPTRAAQPVVLETVWPKLREILPR